MWGCAIDESFVEGDHRFVNRLPLDVRLSHDSEYCRPPERVCRTVESDERGVDGARSAADYHQAASHRREMRRGRGRQQAYSFVDTYCPTSPFTVEFADDSRSLVRSITPPPSVGDERRDCVTDLPLDHPTTRDTGRAQRIRDAGGGAVANPTLGPAVSGHEASRALTGTLHRLD